MCFGTRDGTGSGRAPRWPPRSRVGGRTQLMSMEGRSRCGSADRGALDRASARRVGAGSPGRRRGSAACKPGHRGAGPLTNPMRGSRNEPATTHAETQGAESSRTDRARSGVGSDVANAGEMASAEPGDRGGGEPDGRRTWTSEPTPSLETRRRPRWSRRQMPARAGRSAAGRTSRTHGAPGPADWLEPGRRDDAARRRRGRREKSRRSSAARTRREPWTSAAG